MLHQLLSLSGVWQLDGHSSDNSNHLSIKATVPGQVHLDLMREGILEDLFWRDNAEQSQWIEHWRWIYSTDFTIPPDFQGDWYVLEFLGLDTLCEVFLDGILLGNPHNMFIPHCFDLGSKLTEGSHHLEVRFASLPESLKGQDPNKYAACFSGERVYLRKQQCSFGWDWVQRLVTFGIWRDVRIHAFRKARIKDCYIHTLSLGRESAQMELDMEFDNRCGETLQVEYKVLSPDHHLVYSGESNLHNHSLAIRFEILQPMLWWPNGSGSHPLYELQISILDEKGYRLDSFTTAFGIRSVEIEEIPDSRGKSFTLKINGDRIFCKGGNWVPADPFVSRITPDHYRHLITLANQSHMNLLRAWGGGIYEPEAFWKACDEMGIMVSQDFLLACADYPEESPEFLNLLKVEFECAIRMLRNHPSLVFWAGNNELGMNDNPESNFSGKKISLEISGPLVQSLDPSRPFRLTSPYGGKFNNSPDEGDCHISAWYEPDFFKGDMLDYRERIEALSGRFHSECAIPGAPPLHSLLKFLTREDLMDPEWRILDYHTKDNPYNGIDDLTHVQLLRKTALSIFGHEDDPIRVLEKMEYAQYEFIKLTTEALRRKKFDCSGIQYWMYNDCWPASGWSVVDYYGFPKAGWYGMKKSFQPLMVSIGKGKDLQVWVCNDHLHPLEGLLTVEKVRYSGKRTEVFEKMITIDANHSKCWYSLDVSELARDEVLVATIASPDEQDRSIYIPVLPFEMQLPPAHLTWKQGENELKIRTDTYARVLTLSADLIFSDNYFDLLPGEEKTITWKKYGDWKTGDIRVSCWNLAQ